MFNHIDNKDNKDLPPPNSKYIFLFDDGEICEANDKFKDLQFYFFKSVLRTVPVYFKRPKPEPETIDRVRKSTHYFNDEKKLKPNFCPLKFNELFNSYSTYNCNMIVPSSYNSIYYCHRISCTRIHSNSCKIE